MDRPYDPTYSGVGNIMDVVAVGSEKHLGSKRLRMKAEMHSK